MAGWCFVRFRLFSRCVLCLKFRRRCALVGSAKIWRRGWLKSLKARWLEGAFQDAFIWFVLVWFALERALVKKGVIFFKNRSADADDNPALISAPLPRAP